VSDYFEVSIFTLQVDAKVGSLRRINGDAIDGERLAVLISAVLLSNLVVTQNFTTGVCHCCAIDLGIESVAIIMEGRSATRGVGGADLASILTIEIAGAVGEFGFNSAIAENYGGGAGVIAEIDRAVFG